MRVVFDGAGYPMGAEDSKCAGWHLGEILDELRALRLQAFNDVTVVHDLVANIDRSTMLLQGSFHDVDCANHTRTIATRLSQYDLHGYSHQTARCYRTLHDSEVRPLQWSRLLITPPPASSYYNRGCGGFNSSDRGIIETVASLHVPYTDRSIEDAPMLGKVIASIVRTCCCFPWFVLFVALILTAGAGKYACENFAISTEDRKSTRLNSSH